ncbi:helix-turn-helix domain-containing protein [Micromonospora sp. NPDC049301]|uniref:helix-turn-helix domain-containing protein n=1 Tax=Micromonospora sp. NPDC049301 TaxID=3155723 RepID=UPI0034147648
MHPPEIRARARRLHLSGASIADVARSVGLSYRTVWHWCRDRPEPVVHVTALRCFRCREGVDNPTDQPAYAYLLGLYLGDGHLVTSARVPVLRITCSNAWPGLIEACDSVMRAVLATKVQRIPKIGCVSVESSGKALDLLDIRWRMNLPWSLSVARRDAVAALDRHVGPKF